MELYKKLEVLADAAKYDVSCASSGTDRSRKQGSLGNAVACGICHTWTDDGRCVSLLKLLMTNKCIYDCAYCLNRSSNDVPRAEFTPEEIAELTMEFYRRNYIEGLFLSSGVVKSSDYTMERLIRTLELLRNVHKFNGYIHVKVIPGASPSLIKSIGMLADRVSVNIELPTAQSLKLLAPQKDGDAILKPMGQIMQVKEEYGGRRLSYKEKFAPAGQSTQLIIGASPENDLQVMSLTQSLYDKFKLKRVYYSAYVAVGRHPMLPMVQTPPPLLREHRLYQADWLLRFYGFRADELLDEEHQNFSVDKDPKCDWALRNLHRFPVEVNSADYEMLLRVPGIGVQSAQRIVRARRHSFLTLESLKKIGVVMKRAKFFVTAGGKHDGAMLLGTEALAGMVTDLVSNKPKYEQLTFFVPPQKVFEPIDMMRLVRGEV